MSTTPQKSMGRAAAMVLALLIGAGPAWAQSKVYAKVRTRQNARYQGAIKYRPSSQTYVITVKLASGRTSVTDVKLTDVTSLVVMKPPALRAAIRQVQGGDYSSPVPSLERILRDYQMLQHDVTAARWLAECYVKKKQLDAAIRMCEKVIRRGGANLSGDFVHVYWEALLQSKKFGRLRSELLKGIEEGNREVAAVALLIRGDLDMQEGRHKEALRDNFLRIAMFHQEQKTVLVEALHKAAQCYEKLEQPKQAENMRKKLRAKFPKHKYAKAVE